MSVENNKRIVQRYFDLTAKGDFQGTFDLMSEDFVLRGMGMPPMAYEMSKNEIKEAVKGVSQEVSEPLVFAINGMTAEDERVAVEAERHTKLKDGGSYDNQYHFLFIVRDGLIHRIHEYLCTFTLHRHFERTSASQH